MEKITPREVVLKAYNGHRHCITPNVIRYEQLSPTVVIEYSWGDGFVCEDIYGVSVVVDGKPNHDLSKSFKAPRHAEAYIEVLRKKFNPTGGKV